MTSALRHFAVISSPTPGHLNPLQVLGRTLVERGHRVTMVHVPDAAHLITDPAIGYAPLPDAGIADPFDVFLGKLARPNGPVGLQRMIRSTATMTQALLSGAPGVIERIGADAVIADAVEPAGPLVARQLGIPYAYTVTGLPLLAELGVPPPFMGWRYWPGMAGRVRNHGGYAMADVLMRPLARVLDDHRRRWGLSDTEDDALYVAQCPRGLDYPRNELPPRFRYGTRWRRAATAALDLPRDDRPLIFCSLGSLQGSRRALFATMAAACAAAGGRAVIGHGGGLTPDEAAALPGDPLVRAFWPQERVLEHCSAAILHGGFNTVLDALAVGVPIVALPIAFEQPGTASRL
ncbi:MAG TPA: glycosyltransferase, partial [Sphingomonas sp.]